MWNRISGSRVAAASRRRLRDAGPKRKLLFEFLERRRLLAADATPIPTISIDEAATPSLDSPGLIHEGSSAVSGVQFVDSDHDGVLDAGEPGLGGVTVYVDYNNNGLLDGGEPSAVSGADGSYSISNVNDGANWVRRIWPDDFTPSAVGQGQDRLVAIRDVNDVNSSTGEVLLFRNIDPQTGAWGTELTTDIPIVNPIASATDGTYFYIVDNSLKVMIQTTPQGGVVHYTPLPLALDGSQPYTPGPTVVGDRVFVISDDDRIHDWDPETGDFTRSRTIQIAPDITTLPNGVPVVSGSTAESLDGETIMLLSFSDDRAFELDPDTATLTRVFDFPGTEGSDWAAASVGGEFFYRGVGSNGALTVYNEQLNLVRNIGNPAAPSLVGGTFVEYGTEIDTTNNATLNQGYLSITESITGVVSLDGNGNGAVDPGEQGITGVTVYLDDNGNDWLDPGEPSTTTASDGSYTINGVPQGQHVVKALSPEHFRPSDVYARQDRLFAVNHSLGNNLRLFEMDPDDGTVLVSIDLDIPASPHVGLEYDGKRLILVHHADQMIYEIATDGTIIDSRRLGEVVPTGGISNETDFGPVEIAGSIYNLRRFGDFLYIMQYVPEADEFRWHLPVTWDWGLETYPVSYQPTLPSITPFSTGASADGTSIVLASSDGRDILVDPLTGIATFPTGPISDPRTDASSAAVGGRHLKSFFNSSTLEVFDEHGTVVDSWQLSHSLAGLGGGSDFIDGVQVTVNPNQSATDVIVHLQSTLSTVGGVVFDDVDANGVQDLGDLPLPNVDVFLDTNRNRMFDLGEPVSVTDIAGNYLFQGIPEGEYFVRQIPVASRISNAVTEDATRLFVARLNTTLNQLEILELDTLGSVRRSFPAPGLYSNTTGLALLENKLYLAQGSTLHVIDADSGNLLETRSLPAASINGVAILGETAYFQDYQTDEILVYDLARGVVTGRLDLGLINNGAAGSISLLASIGESADGQNLAVTQASSILIVDPGSGLIVYELPISSITSVAGAGSELFTTRSPSVGRVYDHLGLIRRNLSIPYSQFGYYALGAGRDLATEHRIVVAKESHNDDLDFSNKMETGSASGVFFADGNENGLKESSEPGLAGATVYVDLNQNDWPDPSEPQAVTDLDGNYEVSGISPDPVALRFVYPSGYQPTSSSVANDRLFGARLNTDVSSSTGLRLVIRELSPEDGRVLGEYLTDIETRSPVSMAYDGRVLIVVDNYRDKLLEMTVQGDVIDEVDLPGAPNSVNSYGPVVVNGTVYLLTNFGGESPSLRSYDAETNVFGSPVAITHDYDPAGGILDYSWALSESPDGQSIIAFNDGSPRAFVIDPVSGVVVRDELVAAFGAFVYGATALGGNLLVSHGNSSGRIEVFDSDFGSLGDLGPFITSVQGLGGARYADYSFAVNLDPGESQSGLNQGFRTVMPPMDVSLSTNRINENIDSLAGDLLLASISIDDPDDADHLIQLAAGPGDADNGLFLIADDELYLRQGHVVDFESQPSYELRIKVTDQTGLSFQKLIVVSVNNLVEISKDDVTVGDGTDQRSTVQIASVQFDTEVVIQPDAFQITNANGAAIAVSATTRLDHLGRTVADLTFSGEGTRFGMLQDGRYLMQLDGAKVLSIEGQGMDSDSDGSVGDLFLFGDHASDEFYALLGDSDGDRKVDAQDMGRFGQTYLKSDSDTGFNGAFDFDDDGDVDGLDYSRFRSNFMRRL